MQNNNNVMFIIINVLYNKQFIMDWLSKGIVKFVVLKTSIQASRLI